MANQEQFWDEILPELANKLDQVSQTIASNTYIGETKRQLRKIIEDARSETLILFIGNRETGKSTIINGLVGREIIARNRGEFATANTFIRYGDKERITAYFYDDVEETFELDRLPLLTSSESHTSKLLQSNIDYINVYLSEPMLKQMTLIDTLSLEQEDQAPFLSPALLNRVDEIFWVLRPDKEIDAEELRVIEHLREREVRPYCIINEIEDQQQNAAFVAMVKEQYGHLFDEVIYVAALEIESYLATGEQIHFEASRFQSLVDKLAQFAKDKEARTRRILLRFIEWLERFEIETSLLPKREPLATAVDELKHYESNVMLTTAQHQQSIAAIATHEAAYAHAATVFEDVRTLYQLLQALQDASYLTDEVIIEFTMKAEAYLQTVLTYRKAHAAYEQSVAQVQQRLNAIAEEQRADILADPEAPIHQDVAYAHELFDAMMVSYTSIAEAEQHVTSRWAAVEQRLRNNHRNELSFQLKAANHLIETRQKELAALKLSVIKMNEFTCLIEAQGLLRSVVWGYISKTELPLSAKEKAYMDELIQAISRVDLSGNGILTRSGAVNVVNQKMDVVTFEDRYQVTQLQLEENGLKSADIPPLPKKVTL